MSRCNKCSQAEPFQGDSWCLACSGVEALGEELKAAWGSIGSRALAADSIRSCVRTVRGLRRLGIAGAGKIRVASPEVAGASRAASAAKTPLPPPPAPPVPLAGPRAPAGESPARPVKQEPEANSSEYSEGSESEEVEVDPEDRNRPLEGTNPAGLKAAPKSKPVNREESPRRRPEEDRREREADHSRAPSHRERSRRSERDRRDRDRERSRSHRRDHQPHKGSGRGRKKRKRKHRAGSRHQRLYRAAEDPFRRFHHRQRGDFWDEFPDER